VLTAAGRPGATPRSRPRLRHLHDVLQSAGDRGIRQAAGGCGSTVARSDFTTLLQSIALYAAED
jgi:hypothetical protein